MSEEIKPKKKTKHVLMIEKINKIIDYAYLKDDPSFNFEVKQRNLSLRTSIKCQPSELASALKKCKGSFRIHKDGGMAIFMRKDVFSFLVACYMFAEQNRIPFLSEEFGNDYIDIVLMTHI